MKRLRHARIAVDIALVLSVVVGVGMFVFAARLAQGPVPLAILAPFVERALNPAGQPFSVRLSGAAIAWNASEAAIDLRAIDVQVIGADQAVKVRLPEVSLGLSLAALMSGRLAPASIGIEGARLHVVRRADKSFDFDLGAETASGDDVIEQLLADLVGGGTGRASALTRVTIANAALLVEDRARGTTWAAPEATIDLRRGAGGIAIDAAVTVQAGGLGGRLKAVGHYDPKSEGARLELAFDDLAPRLLALIEPQLAELARIDLPLGGRLSLTFDRSFWPVGARLDLRGGAGMIHVREFYPDPVEVTGIGLRAEVVDGFTRLLVEEARVERGEMVVRVSGSAKRDAGLIELSLDAELTGLAVNELAELWPAGLAKGARAWTTSNIRDGLVKVATLHLVGAGPAEDLDALKVVELGGKIEVQGASVHYLRPMRPVVQVDGVAEYDRRHFLIHTKGGFVGATKIAKGVIDLLDLDLPDKERAKIVVSVSGPTRDALALIDERPLGYARAIGLKPQTAAGTHATEVTLEFPLLVDLPLNELSLHANSRLSAFAMPDIAFGHAVEQGELRAAVDKDHLELSGGLKIAGAQLDVRLSRAFSAKAPVQQKISATGTLGDDARAQLGFRLAPYVTGPLQAAVEYEERANGTGVGSVALDLAPAELSVPWAGWSKPAERKATARFGFETKSGRVARLPAFTAEAEGMRVNGAASLRDAGGAMELAQLDLDRLVLGATDLRARLLRADDGGWAISLGGERLDLAPLLAAAPAGGAGQSGLPPLRIEIAPGAPLGELRVSSAAAVQSVAGSVTYDGTRWTPVMLEGKAGRGEIHLQIGSAADGRRLLIEAEDASAAIALIGISEGLADGELKIVGRFDDADPAQPLSGQVAIANLRVTKAPTLAQILTLASLTGIGNTLSGRGIEFDSVVVPFRLTDAAIDIKDARVVGSQLGISASGRIDRLAERIALEGELVPAYTLNSLVRRIPLIGRLLTGGAEGLFAATYRVEGPLADPKVSVNPLSVLAPGFARVIIEQIGKPSPLEAEPEFPKPRDE